MNALDRLLDQIDAFIRKYYKNQMLKGAIWFAGVLLSSFLLATTLEYFGRFNSWVRGFLFFSFILLNGFVLVKYLIVPTLRLNALGERIDRYQAADIIGSFFPSISDRLKNTLQLKDSLDSNVGNLELIRASVAQRSSSLNVYSFVTAVDLRENRRYLKWVIPIFLVVLSIAVFLPAVFQQGTKRVVNYTQEFKPVAPFDFHLLNNSLNVFEGEDLLIDLKISGNSLPEKVYLVSDRGRFLMDKSAKNSFGMKLEKLMSNGKFYFETDEFSSREFEYRVLGKATLGLFEARLVYPDYLGKENEIISNAGDLTLPEGTKVLWKVFAKNTKEIVLKWNGKAEVFKTAGFNFTREVREESKVGVFLSGIEKGSQDSVLFNVHVIKDIHPSIDVLEETDSVNNGLKYFKGQVGDDYGLRSLSFVYTIYSEDGTKRQERMNVNPVSGTQMPFDFAVDFRREKIKLKDRIEYYFVVNDNDGVNGSKATKSGTFVYQLPTLEELNEQRDEEQETSLNELNDLLTKAKDHKKNLELLRKEALNSKSNSWKSQEQVRQLMEEQNSLINDLKELNRSLERSLENKNQLSELEEQLLEKQEMINDLLKELENDEIKKLLEELQKLMEQQNREELNEKFQELDQSLEEQNRQMDRALEMLKKERVNEKIDALENELKELAQDQESLKEDIEKDHLNKNEQVEEQDKINERFNQLKEDLDELLKLNEELKNPLDLGNPKDKEGAIDEELKESKENLDKGKQGKATQNQQSAADQMEQMAQQMDMAQQDANQKQQGEDMESLRKILEALVTLSLDQEGLMDDFKRVSSNDPKYVRLGREQRRIISETKGVSDSLYALAKRQPMIASFIDKELNAIHSNHSLSMEDIDEHKRRELGTHQQLVMTSYNNLALLLNESLQKMQQQMQSMMPGSGSCDKPGGNGQPKPGDGMKPGSLKDALQKQLDQLQKGKGPKEGGQEPGTKPGNGSAGMGNQQLAKMAAQQAMIRQQLEKMRSELNKDGSGKGNGLNPLLKELEEQEKALVNKRIDQSVVDRQKRILTRLLEHEKAMEERDFDDKRESKEGKNENFSNQIRFDEYNKLKRQQIELLRAVDPNYGKYYKDKANQYFNR